MISIHALREEGDLLKTDLGEHIAEFLSTPSARRATLLRSFGLSGSAQFLSTPSARRATIFHEDADTALMISIHALREEGDLFSQQGFAVVGISIHALREEGDPCFVAQPLFQQISIHALREEGDPGRPRNGHDRGHFYPRPPRGGRQES